MKHHSQPPRIFPMIPAFGLSMAVAVTWLLMMMMGLTACASAPNGNANSAPTVAGASSPSEDWRDVKTDAVQAVLSIESPDHTVGSFELFVTFDPTQIVLYDIEKLVPDPLQLHVDRAQFSSGRVRIMGTNESALTADRGGVPRQSGPRGTFEIARLFFTPAIGMQREISEQALQWSFDQCRAFSPLPEQDFIPARFRVQFYHVVTIPARDS